MPNPYLQDQANAITGQVTKNLQRNILPGINSSAIAAGGFGGSRQGVAQGMAIGDTNQALSNSLASLYGNAYEGDQNRALQQGIASMNNQTQRDLGFGQLGFNYWTGANNFGLQNKSLDQNFYTANRGQDLQQMSLGSQMVNQGNLGLSNAGQGLYGIGQQQMQNSFQPIQNFAGAVSPFTGLNSTRTDTTPGASTVGSALGGAMTLAQLWKIFGG